MHQHLEEYDINQLWPRLTKPRSCWIDHDEIFSKLRVANRRNKRYNIIYRSRHGCCREILGITCFDWHCYYKGICSTGQSIELLEGLGSTLRIFGWSCFKEIQCEPFPVPHCCQILWVVWSCIPCNRAGDLKM